MSERLSQITPEMRARWSNYGIALVEDRLEFAQLFEEIFREEAGLKDITIHQFTTCEKFIEAPNISEFDACFLDGDFGLGRKKGPEAVQDIRTLEPSMIIVGLTDREEHLEAFEEVGTDLNIKKADLIKSLDKILSLEKHNNR